MPHVFRQAVTVAVLGASVLLNLAPAAFAADEPAVAGRASILDATTTPQPAVERWKRLKSQYEPAPAAVPRSRTPANTRLIPADPDAVRSGAIDGETPVPTRAATSPAPVGFSAPPAVPATASKALPSAGRAPEWELPDPVSADELESDDPASDRGFDRPLIDEFPRVETDPAVSDPALLDDDRIAYERRTDGTSPADVPPAETGTRRPNLPVPGAPPLKTTQVRPMRDITPRDDANQDSAIKRYAAEKAQEFPVRFGGDAYTPRNFPEVSATWTAPTTKYYPLYFQDPALERYGHTHHPLLQPVVSSARFSGQLVMMPYQMTIAPPWELRSPLGWYRPGDVVPKLRYPFPWNAKAAAVEAAAITGFIYVIP